MSLEQLESYHAELESLLSPEELACKYGIVRNLSAEAFETIAFIEDAEIALGTHPGVK